MADLAVQEIGEKRVLNMVRTQLTEIMLEMSDQDTINLSNPVMNILADLRDTGSCVHQMRQVEGFEDYKIPRDSTIRKIHNKVSKDFHKVRTRNKVIPYTEAEGKLEMEVRGYTFVNARDTHTLVDVGISLNMCVGGYGIRAVAKSTNIVLVYDENDALTLCIEHRNRRLVQVKGYSDRLPSLDERDVVLNWAEANNLAWNCYDMNPRRCTPNNLFEGVAPAALVEEADQDAYLMPPQAQVLAPAAPMGDDAVPF
jgi:hypothetical protein